MEFQLSGTKYVLEKLGRDYEDPSPKAVAALSEYFARTCTLISRLLETGHRIQASYFMDRIGVLLDLFYAAAIDALRKKTFEVRGDEGTTVRKGDLPAQVFRALVFCHYMGTSLEWIRNFEKERLDLMAKPCSACDNVGSGLVGEAITKLKKQNSTGNQESGELSNSLAAHQHPGAAGRFVSRLYARPREVDRHSLAKHTQAVIVYIMVCLEKSIRLLPLSDESVPPKLMAKVNKHKKTEDWKRPFPEFLFTDISSEYYGYYQELIKIVDEVIEEFFLDITTVAKSPTHITEWVDRS